ncbi:MAG: hypothetical protein E7059_03130 [Treponema bryantii]|nr:hypothetical protein [Treponema bryantii]
MKKLLMIISLMAIFSMGLFAQENNGVGQYEKDESKWSSISYVNVPILKILEGVDAYVVVYQKNKVGVGQTVIPKSWAQGDPENPRKLKFRTVKNNINSFMTIVKKDGEFHRVILTAPLDKKRSIWGLTKSRKSIEGSDKETLEEIEL